MKDLLNYIVTNIVTKPEAVQIEETIEDGVVDLTLIVDPTDMGLVIGKSGQTIKAIRKLLTVRAIAENVRVNLQLIEPAGGKPTEPEEQVETPQESEEIATSVEDSTSSQ